MPATCTICCDEEVHIRFECGTPDCEFKLCNGCLTDAFKDFSGQNCEECPFCKRIIALRMAEAQIGKGGVKAVERELRKTVEHEVRKEQGLYDAGKKEASEVSEEAVRQFNIVSNELNLVCPRCKLAFHDYEGCNALTCANGQCRATFCAICLKDCGTDAHPHVRQHHGDLFDKAMFYEASKERSKQVVEGFLAKLEEQGASFELIQSVKNLLERAGLFGGSDSSSEKSRTSAYILSKFISDASQDLERVIEADRLSVLSESWGSDWRRDGLTCDDISPRAATPNDIRIWLVQSGEEFELKVDALIDHGWRQADSLDQLKEWIRDGLIAPSGSLANLKQALRCAVVALEGERKLYQVRRVGSSQEGSSRTKLKFTAIDRQGREDVHNTRSFDYDRARRIQVLALNPNNRYLELLEHITTKVSANTIPEPIRHFLGTGSPVPVFTELHAAVPKTIHELNDDQRSAGHPLCLKTAGEVAGPPGTGKTKTISALVQALLRCTDKDIVVLSERNGAIDAIAEKFASLCIQGRAKKAVVTDLPMWNKVLTFGSAEAMGEHTKLFLLDEKLKYHPEIVEAQKIARECKDACAKHARKMRNDLGEKIQEFADKWNDESAWNQGPKIRHSKDESFQTPSQVQTITERAKQNAQDLLKEGNEEFNLHALDAYIDRNYIIVGQLFPMSLPDKEALHRLKDVVMYLEQVLHTELFDEAILAEMNARHEEAEKTKQSVETRLKKELAEISRLRMSTIGSSHQLFSQNSSNGEDKNDVETRLERLAVDDDVVFLKEDSIVIFDESGCIPSYELLGLSRLECKIAALLTVGDKKQLPPYNPGISPTSKSRQRSTPREEYKLKSLLDVSEVKEKIALRTQYRVPRDIAGILNSRVYNGSYTTPPGANVADRGLRFLHVEPPRERQRKKYVNSAEVNEVLRIVDAMDLERCTPVMILTPYKNQQREIQFQLKKKGISAEVCAVLTIDQCQGQEADTVVLSLVQKPTRFLNRNRLNVAMSRTRNELIIIGDRLRFQEASQESNWECNLIARDILTSTAF